MLVCLCKGVSDKHVRAAITRGAATVEDIGDDCGAGTGCGACVPMLEEMLGARGAELSVHELVRLTAESGGRCVDCPRRATAPLVASSSRELRNDEAA